MTSVAITGASGMLGRDLCQVFSDTNPRCLAKNDLDITSEDAIRQALDGVDVVINAAAYTAVDQAEVEVELAMAVNSTGPRLLASHCKDAGIRLIHLSTDYVFNGAAHEPYPEHTPPDPQSVYGRSKAAGERAVLEVWPEGSIIVRTAWLYGEHGSSFPRTMLALASERDTVSVVDDQVGQPTWTMDLAHQIRLLVDSDIRRGIFHGTNAGQTSWWDFARTIFRAAGYDDSRVLQTTSKDFVRPAPRPAWSVLGHDAWAKAGLPAPRPWEEAFDEAFDQFFRALVTAAR
jgi:dTDP-4-dehydrorhamnose reductase